VRDVLGHRLRASVDTHSFFPLVVLSEESGEVGELLTLDSRINAVMKLLPSEEYALSATSTPH
jgi:hypothetical protein